MKTLVLMVGLPYSGKSTYARSTGHPIVNPDALRLALHGSRFIASAEPLVWAHARWMVRGLFLAGHNTVILDATNITRKRRDEWRSDEWNTITYEVRTNLEICLERARAAGDEEIIPVIHRMAAQYEAPVQPGRVGGRALMAGALKPALTPEEWEQHDQLREMYESSEDWYRYLGTYTAHATAARCLRDQPFGFTREDVDDEIAELEVLKQHGEWLKAQGGDHRRIRKMVGRKRGRIARLEALLPPEGS